MSTGNLTFGDFEQMLNDWIKDTDELEDTFQFQFKELGRLQMASQKNYEKFEAFEKKFHELVRIGQLIDSDLFCASELQIHLEHALANVENRLSVMERQPHLIDQQRHQIYSTVEQLFTKFAYCKDLLDLVHEEKSQESQSPLNRISRLLMMEIIVLEHTEKRINKLNKYLEKIDLQKKFLPKVLDNDVQFPVLNMYTNKK